MEVPRHLPFGRSPSGHLEQHQVDRGGRVIRFVQQRLQACDWLAWACSFKRTSPPFGLTSAIAEWHRAVHAPVVLSPCVLFQTFWRQKRGFISPLAAFLLNIAALFNKTVGYKDAGTQTHLFVADPLVRPTNKPHAMIAHLRVALIFAVCRMFVFGADSTPKPITKNVETWTPPKYATVVGYRHDFDSGDGHFSLIKEGQLDTDRLAQITTGSATLTPEQVTKLTSALYTEQRYGFVACYDPHHLFVFYSDSGAVVAAIEICFKCRGLAAFPRMPESFSRHHDLIALARLVDSLGLWQGKKPCAEWISEHEAHLKE